MLRRDQQQPGLHPPECSRHGQHNLRLGEIILPPGSTVADQIRRHHLSPGITWAVVNSFSGPESAHSPQGKKISVLGAMSHPTLVIPSRGNLPR